MALLIQTLVPDGVELAKAPLRKPFDPGRVYTFDLSDSVRFMNIPTATLMDLFKDGRVLGLIMEYALAAEFTDLTVETSKAKHYDLFQSPRKGVEKDTVKTWEHKLMTTGGANLAPSNMKGQNRSFDRAKFEKTVNSVTGYIITDARSFPKIKVFAVPSDVLASMAYPQFIRDGNIDEAIRASKQHSLRGRAEWKGDDKKGHTLKIDNKTFTVKRNDSNPPKWVLRLNGKVLNNNLPTSRKAIDLAMMTLYQLEQPAQVGKAGAKKPTTKKAASKKATKAARKK